MLDVLSLPRAQRSRGTASVSLGVRDGRTRVEGLFQSGSARMVMPATHGGAPEVVFLNTAGGLTSGDRLDYALAVDDGLRATGTTQSAERAYAAPEGPAEIGVAVRVGAGARVDWLPQETILFDRAALSRRTVIDLAGEASCLLAETLVLGRAAMGETLRRLDLRDTRLVRRDGRVVFAECLRIDGGALAAGAHAAMLGGARAVATVALIGRGAEAALEAVRRALGVEAVEAAASAWDGRCVVRVAGPDGWPVRRQVARVLGVLRDGPLPLVWQG